MTRSLYRYLSLLETFLRSYRFTKLTSSASRRRGAVFAMLLLATFLFGGYAAFASYSRVSPVAPTGAFTAGNLAVFQATSASANNTTFSIVELSPTTAGQTTPGVQTIAIDGTTAPNALRTSGSATSTGYLATTNDGTLLSFDAHNSTTTSGNANTITARGVGTLNAAGTFAIQTTYTGANGNQARGATSLNNTNWFIADQGGVYTNGATSASPSGNLRGIKSFGGTVYTLQQSSTASVIVVNTVSAASGGTITGLPGLTNNNNAQDFYLISSGDNGVAFDVLYITNNTSATAGTIQKFSLVGGSWVANGSYTTNFGGFGLAAADNGNGALLYVSSGSGATAANNVIRLADTAGYNSTISITTANNVTLYTAPAGTTVKGVAFAPANGADAAPTVSSTSPTDGATNVPTSGAITINFSEAVNLTASAVTLECPSGTPQTFAGLPAGNVSKNAAGAHCLFDHSGQRHCCDWQRYGRTFRARLPDALSQRCHTAHRRQFQL